MKITDIRLVDPKKINNAEALKIYNGFKKDTENFNEELMEVFDDAILSFLKVLKSGRPEAFREPKTPTPRTPRTPRTPKAPTPRTPKGEDEEEDLVDQVMEDYQLTRDKALRLIALRKEAIELKKENIEKLVDRLDKSEFYEGRNRVSRSPIDKGRTRDLGKDSSQRALTSAEERKMTGTPFKRISKAGRKNQFGETTGGKVYYEYRQNRRDVDNRIKLATGGVLGQDVTYKYYDEQRTGEIISELPNGYEVASKWGTVLVSPKEVISITAPKKKRFSFFKKGGSIRVKSMATIITTQSDEETANDIAEEMTDLTSKEFTVREQDGYYVIEGEISAKDFREMPDIENEFEFLNVPNEWVVKFGTLENEEFSRRIHSVEFYHNTYEFASNSYEIEISKADGVITVEEPEEYAISKFKKGGDVGIPNADKMFHLPYEIAVYVPSTKDVDKTITATELRARVKEVEKYLAETFGGFTSSEKVGGYLSSKSAIVTEKVVPVTAFSSLNDFTANKSKLINKMSVWSKKWGQEAIGFEFEGDLYYVPQKFKTGGTLKATYIPKRDIKMLTTVWGNNIKGKDLIDGAYTKRKAIKKAPKVARTQFEDETFEYKTGGLIAYSNDDYKVKKIGSFSSISEAKKFARTNKSKYDTIIFEDEFGDNIVVTKSDTLKDIDWLFSDEYKKGGKLDARYIPKRDIKSIETIWGNKISGKDLIDGAYTKRTNIKTAPKVARTMFEDETFEYGKGGRLDLFEDYENIPTNVQKVLDKYAKKFGEDYSGMSYQDMKKMHDEIYKLGYTFDSGLDNQAFGLRPIGVNLNELVGYEDEENDK